MSQQANLAVSFNQHFGRFPIIFLSRWLLLVDPTTTSRP